MLTVTQVYAVADAVGLRYRALVLLAAFTGLHPSRERQRAMADAVGEAARAELAKPKTPKAAEPSDAQRHETGAPRLRVMNDLCP